jgi:pimeloyl-ACP methyl ester carboxylesterase
MTTAVDVPNSFLSSDHVRRQRAWPSTGTATYDPFETAKDPRDLIAELGLRDVVVAGWSLGESAQVAFARYGDALANIEFGHGVTLFSSRVRSSQRHRSSRPSMRRRSQSSTSVAPRHHLPWREIWYALPKLQHLTSSRRPRR